MTIRRPPESAEPLGFEPLGPVQWLAPRELTAAAIRVGLSTAFGEYSDKREFERTLDPSLHTDADGAEEVWLDYVSDIGDGFDATYSIAELLSRQSLEVEGAPVLPRGSVLLLGGDQVYPTAGRDQYRNRMTGPYRSVFPPGAPPEAGDPPRPQMFAVPGNHDWYDGLTSFIRIFCDRDSLGGWSLPQSRSYFAIALTDKWWLWGIDIQFDGYIDTPQVDFFRKASAEHLQPGDGLILCSAKPSWVHAVNDEKRPTASMRNLDYFVGTCVPEGVSVRLNLAGDWHHYGRYEETATGAAYVISGGGGAYLSATHHLVDQITVRAPDVANDVRLELRTTYPDRSESKRRRLSGITVGWKNKTFALLVGFLYLLLATISQGSRQGNAFVARLVQLGNSGASHAFGAALRGVLTSAGGIAMIVAFGAALVGLATPRKLPRPWVGYVAGGMHVVAHIVCFAACAAIGTVAVSALGDDPPQGLVWLVWVVTLTAAGALLGSVVFGAYLGLADIVGVNTNELFAGQRIEGRKNFLRMRVTPDEITVFVIALDDCVRWEVDPSATGDQPRFRPRETHSSRWSKRHGDGSATKPRLLETFTVSTLRAPTTAAPNVR